jgi:hypothetical protein
MGIGKPVIYRACLEMLQAEGKTAAGLALSQQQVA